ncbi:ribonuclease R [Meiothermus taiwanensis]|jgi:ribonuclease R|uniref:Ribonuclease R n=2 Tax=Meiothermus taiwanensis TaxID=172827 RepID=A0A399E957_9DEIN|nr:ribonuclease R [Meiothermus taiwanensis]AWR86620.1 ribonuclease R [Meiothermus taiwanensis WR-220]KIQ55576.1 ribonuclease R [Meiothermus taiwanensis]KZK15983.1 ribonuclease R [Meiothermus taiwanensis]RIH78582.1 Ribonuclease R [Meiothermus taiwanensis]
MLEQRIYEHLKKHPKKRFSLRELVRSLRLDKDEAKEALDLLVAEGKVVEPRRKLYQLPEGLGKKGLEGRLQAHAAGFAFVIPSNPDLPDLYIPKGYLGGAWHGDLVRAEPRPPGRDGKPWGVVVEVLERAHHQVVGRLYFKRGYAWLKPDDPRLPALKLKPEGLEGLESGARLVVRITYPSGRKPQEPYGEFAGYLGQGESPEVETEAIIAKYELRSVFPPEALAEAEKVAHLDAKEIARREDFRALRVFTIDGADAKDFDDAIHIELLPNGNYRVGIHIADVSHYVREFSPLDQEAYARATSVYLPGRVLPMLPEQLSNGICSLKPHEDRLVLSVLVELTPKGRVKHYRFAEGVIRSVARLTYTEVEAFAASGKAPTPDWSPELQNDLKLLLELTRTLKERRLEQGALDFRFTEVKVEVDEDGNLHLIPQKEPRARSLIEELMLLANRVVAKHLAERQIPTLFRVHEDPSEEAYNKLVAALGRLGYSLPGGEPSPKALQSILKQAEGRPEEAVVSTLLLRSLRLARYAAENLGHFGLAAEHYLHFTSPIRRYPDLVVHRVLRALLKRRVTQARKEEWAQRFPKIAEHASERERAAENAERELTKYYQCLWAQKHQGETFRGTVSGVTGFGVFVSLDNGVEGMIRLGALEDDHYQYIEELLALEGLRTKRRIRIGDEMEVKIEGANPSARQIDLVPTEKFYQTETQPEVEPQKRKKRRRGKRGKAAAPAQPARKVVATEPKSPPPHARARSRRVVGPPEERPGFQKPVKVKAQKIYFGSWGSDQEQTPPDKTEKSGKKKRRRR